MKILFLDQSGSLGGAELFLLDLATFFGSSCAVVLLSDGAFRQALAERQIPVQVLTGKALAIKKESGLRQSLSSLTQLMPLITQVAKLAQAYDVIYANTQKALVIGSIASWLARRPLVYHLHDIVAPEHFSAINRRIITTLANRAALVIANSEASKTALIAAGGTNSIEVVYNGFDLHQYEIDSDSQHRIRQALGWENRFIVGHFSRLSPWKGQHVLIEALQFCPTDVVAIFVGDALFGETLYAEQLHQQVQQLGLTDRVQFLGFRADVPQLMAACDLIAHTSTAPEPFGRVIVEGMLSGKPVVASAAGGAKEIINPQVTGWLSPPNDPASLANLITTCYHAPEQAETIANQAKVAASKKFDLNAINQAIENLLSHNISKQRSTQG